MTRIISKSLVRVRASAPMTGQMVREQLRGWAIDAAHLREPMCSADPAHYDRLRVQILTAMERAPAGRPAVFMGIGKGNELPGEIFSAKFVRKFPQVYFVDLCMDLLESMLSRFSGMYPIADQRSSGRIQLVEENLSGVNPDSIAYLANEALKGPTLEQAKFRIAEIFANPDEIPGPFIKPFSVVEKGQAGLVISSTLFPDCIASFYVALERMVRGSYDSDFNLHDPRYFDFTLFPPIARHSHWVGKAIAKYHQKNPS